MHETVAKVDLIQVYLRTQVNQLNIHMNQVNIQVNLRTHVNHVNIQVNDVNNEHTGEPGGPEDTGEPGE